jgi:sugar lactone lactonase YvrE
MTAGRVYRMAGNGLTTYSGDNGPALAAQIGGPAGSLDELAVDPAGNVVIGDGANSRVRVLATQSGSFYGQPMATGDIYTIIGNGQTSAPPQGPTPQASLGIGVGGLAIDPAGDLAVSDMNYAVWVLPAAAGQQFGQQMTPGTVYPVNVCGGVNCLTLLRSIAFDRAGNAVLDICGPNDFDTAKLLLLAAQDGTDLGQSVTAGDVYRLAGSTVGFAGDGGPALDAQLTCAGVAVDQQGNLLLADAGNHRVRVIAASTGTFYGLAMTAGDIYTIAGSGSATDSGDGGPAAQAGIADPVSIAVDASGNLIIADETANRVRVIAAAPGTFYGVAMTAGDIYTIAGTGVAGFTGDGGPATDAELAAPSAVAVTPSGGVLVADAIRVRLIAG